MRLVVRLLGAEVLALDLGPDRREPPPAPAPARCRFREPERPAIEASGGGQFERADPGFGFD